MASEEMDELTFGLADLSDLRRLVSSRAIQAGLSDRRAADVALAAGEIATNAIRHGRPPATMRVWREPGQVVCEVSDAGAGIEDPGTGRTPPPVDAPCGRGIWLARQLTDQLEIEEGVGSTVTIRATGPRPLAATAA